MPEYIENGRILKRFIVGRQTHDAGGAITYIDLRSFDTEEDAQQFIDDMELDDVGHKDVLYYIDDLETTFTRKRL